MQGPFTAWLALPIPVIFAGQRRRADRRRHALLRFRWLLESLPWQPQSGAPCSRCRSARSRASESATGGRFDPTDRFTLIARAWAVRGRVPRW